MKPLRILLGILLAIVALNVFGGGYYGMAGAKDIPLEWLNGSSFKSYFFPSLFLFAIVTSVCLVGAVFAFGNSIYTRPVSIVCAGLLIS